MTSANSSWSEKLKANGKSMGKRRLWAYVLVLPAMCISFVIPMLLMLLRSANYASIHNQTEARYIFEKQSTIMRTLGFSSPLIVLVGGMGIIYAFMCFSYLFNKSKLDFYFSLPTTSARRVLNAFSVALSNFIGIFLAAEALAILIAWAFGALNGAILIAIVIQTIRMIVFFYTCFTITTFAILLCGTRIMAILIAAFLFCITTFLCYELDFLNQTFFVTSSYRNELSVFLAPAFDVAKVIRSTARTLRDIGMNNLGEKRPFEVSYVLDLYRKNIAIYDVDMIVTAIAASFGVFFVYKKRRAEHTGKSVIFRPVRWAVKITGCIIVSLAGMIFIHSMYEAVWSNRLYVLLCVAMLIICIITGAAIEIAFDANVKNFAKGKSQTLMAMAILLLIFFIYRGDLIGYDSYVPNASSVESCSLILENSDFGYAYSDKLGWTYEFDDNMKLTDIDTFLQVAKKSMECSRKNKGNTIYDCGWPVELAYDLKIGKRVYRRAYIPYDIDPALMDKLTSNPEYIKGHCPCFNECFDRNYDYSFEYSNWNGKKSKYSINSQQFIEAYRQDVLDTYKFSYMKDHGYIGKVEIDREETSLVDSFGENSNIGGTFYVYEDFKRTIDFLKKYDLYVDNKIEPSSVSMIKVENMYPDDNFDLLSDEDLITACYDSQYHAFSITYTDQQSIKDILDSIVCDTYTEWTYEYDKFNPQYYVNLYGTKKDGTSDSDAADLEAFDYDDVNAEYFYRFKRHGVPKVVLEDFDFD